MDHARARNYIFPYGKHGGWLRFVAFFVSTVLLLYKFSTHTLDSQVSILLWEAALNLINLSLIMVHLFNHCVQRRGLHGYEPRDCFAYSVFEVAWTYRVGQGLTPFPLGKSHAPWFCHALPRIFSCPCLLAPGGFSLAWYLWSSICLH